MSAPPRNRPRVSCLRSRLGVVIASPRRVLWQKTILVIEDHESRSSLRRIMEAQGHRVVSARNGSDAMRLLVVADRELPGLIVLDLARPNRTGWELITMLRSHVRLAGIPIIMVSARGSHRQTIERGLTADPLPEPFGVTNVMELIELIESVYASEAEERP